MSKYDPLWAHIQQIGGERMTFNFEDIADILGFPMDHSFLNCKKELTAYGYQVKKISLKEQTVLFVKAPAS